MKVVARLTLRLLFPFHLRAFSGWSRDFVGVHQLFLKWSRTHPAFRQRCTEAGSKCLHGEPGYFQECFSGAALQPGIAAAIVLWWWSGSNSEHRAKPLKSHRLCATQREPRAFWQTPDRNGSGRFTVCCAISMDLGQSGGRGGKRGGGIMVKCAGTLCVNEPCGFLCRSPRCSYITCDVMLAAPSPLCAAFIWAKTSRAAAAVPLPQPSCIVWAAYKQPGLWLICPAVCCLHRCEIEAGK